MSGFRSMLPVSAGGETWHASGTVYARPKHPRGCWRCITKDARLGELKHPRQCRAAARPGKLCCPNHRADEHAAQSFKANLDALNAQVASEPCPHEP